MKTFISMVAAGSMALLLTGCGHASSPASPAADTVATGVSNALAGAKNNSDKTIDVSYLNQALQLYLVQEGHYPKTLDELKPNYVPLLPVLPNDFKLDYNATNGEVKVVTQ